jgi:hypothetical protein
MSDSFAGISVPEGSVGELRRAGSELAQQAQVLSHTATGLRAMPTTAGSWIGPAHSAYANRCITAAQAAGLAAQAFIMAAGAAEAYAAELERAKERAREAIQDARVAKKRIERAQEQIQIAQGRQQGAQGRIDAALHAQAVAAMTPGGDAGIADAMLADALNELREAQEEERRWRRALDEAQDDLQRAQERGRRAEQDAREAARTARSLFAAAGEAMPILPPPPTPVQPASTDDRKWYEKAVGWTADQVAAVPGAAKDATVGLVTGVANQIGGAAEYQYNRVFNPHLAWQYEMEQQRATAEMVSDPIGTVKTVVNYDDLAKGNIGAWVGGLAPDLALGALTAGAGPVARATTSTQRVREMSGQRSLDRANEAHDRATRAHGELRPPSRFEDKTVASTNRLTMSGWGHRDLDGFEYVRPEEVKRMADNMDFEIRGAGAADYAGNEPGFKGKHHASHAEAQQLARHPGQPVGVDRGMCDVCQGMFRETARVSDQPLLVQDPHGTRLFLEDGTVVTDPKPGDFPAARHLSPDDVRRGVGAGTGALLVTPQSQP